ncbi:MAG: flagellar protein FhlB [Alphaproteobacteria bacterium]|nr:MAG: flagellar protein FhlB [Alphaproteobacteria bacterium]
MSERKADPRRTAVAIRDDRQAERPVIAATGHGWRAERILDVAFASGVKVREDKALAEMLAAFEEDSPIPIQALYAVCQVLSHVYAASQAAGDAAPTPTPTAKGKPDGHP